MLKNRDISVTQKIFYEKASSFSNFKNITLLQIKEIKESAEKFKKRYEETKAHTSLTPLDFYHFALLYLTNPQIKLTYPTFDEQILFLIFCVDPQLQVFDLFLKSSIINERELNAYQGEEYENKKRERQTNIQSYKRELSHRIGIQNSRLLKYESLYFQKYQREFKTDITNDYLNILLRYCMEIENLENIDEETLRKINLMVQYYLYKIQGTPSANATAFNIINQRALLLLTSKEEQILFFILVSDANLDLLRIYEEESTYPKIKQRALEELGFYSKDLIRIEKEYHRRFCPKKKISIW